MTQLALAGKQAVRQKNWAVANRCATEILRLDRGAADGWFLQGLVAKAGSRPQQAKTALTRAMHNDPSRYDAAVEMADLEQKSGDFAQSAERLERYAPRLGDSPLYLLMAAETYTRLGLHEHAWPLYSQANELQANVDAIQSGLAACSVKLGKLDLARRLYTSLLNRNPAHQRHHFELARLERAKDPGHLQQMQAVLEQSGLAPEKNIFLYYAIGKELEDLGEWGEAFRYYRLGGDAAARQSLAAGYTVDQDIEVIDSLIETCSAEWLQGGPPPTKKAAADADPIFIVGLPRTGTTLTERIISSHSQVESADESFFLRIALKQLSGVSGKADMSPRIIQHAAQVDSSKIARKYLDTIRYRLQGKPWFIDKYPENYQYLGFIARAFPNARMVHLRRHPMDACFAMYKQLYFRQAYTLDDLGRYYIAYDRLSRHWMNTLGDRVIELAYEDLVRDFESQTRLLLQRLGLEFEPACLDFHLNKTASATASAAQIRETVHDRSVGNWKHWEDELSPLVKTLQDAGIDLS